MDSGFELCDMILKRDSKYFIVSKQSKWNFNIFLKNFTIQISLNNFIVFMTRFNDFCAQF